MVPNVASSGSSFKGAFAYYLHDKRQKGEQTRNTSERVAWTETRGISIKDAALAGRIMAATALDQDRLKRQAGIKNTGRKSDKSVYSYSLSWHPDEAGKIDKAEMLRAADESLRAIGAEGRQAVIIAHNDEPQKHVHIIVNRVSPDDGRMLSTSNDFRKLDAWALAYRRERGEEQLYCPARAEKAEAIARKKDGHEVEFVRGDKTTPRSMEPDFAETRAANENSAVKARDQQKTLNAELAANTKAMHERHGRNWAELAAAYKAKQAEIKGQAAGAIERTKDQLKEQYRPQWRTLERRQHDERLQHGEREQTIAGKIKNIRAAIAHRKMIGLTKEDRGWTAAAFIFTTNKQARADALEKWFAAERRQLKTHERRETAKAVEGVKTERGALLSSARQSFGSDRRALIDRHAQDRKEIKHAWTRRHAERGRSFATIRAKTHSRTTAKAEQRPKHARKSEKRRGDIKAALKGVRQARSRSRTRDRGDDGGRER